MIGYGQAFVLGWLAFVAVKIILEKRTGRPWSLPPIVWGATFVGLNWITTLG